MIRKVPEQQIPTLIEEVPLDGAKRVSVEQLVTDSLNFESKNDGESASQRSGDRVRDNRSVDDIAKAALKIVQAELVKILPNLMRQAVDQVLREDSAEGA